jgi:hypothetical protein
MTPADYNTLNSLYTLPAPSSTVLGSPHGHKDIPFAFTSAFGGKNELWKWLYSTQKSDIVGTLHLNKNYRLKGKLSIDIFSEKLRSKLSIAPLFTSTAGVTGPKHTGKITFTGTLPLDRKYLLWDIETFSSFLPVIQGTRILENIPFLSVCQPVVNGVLKAPDVWFTAEPDLHEIWMTIKSQISDLSCTVVTYSDYEWVCLSALLDAVEAQGITVQEDRAWLKIRKSASIDLYQIVLGRPEFSTLPSKSLKQVAPLFVPHPYKSLGIQDGLTASDTYVKHFFSAKGKKPWYVQNQLIAYCKTDVRVMHPILVGCASPSPSFVPSSAILAA